MLSEANLSVCETTANLSVSEATATAATANAATILTNKDREDLFESICLLMESYIDVNIQQYIQPNFHLSVFNSIVNTLTNTLIDLDLDIKEFVEKEVERALALFYKHIAPPRSSGNTFIRLSKPCLNILKAKVQYLLTIPQPEQRTTAWYEFRYKHLTASNIWKVFISDSTRNQLIYEKCQPLITAKYSGCGSLESPMHWGQKYEPLSVMLYEEIYKAKVSDFGCIPHRTLEFLAASPDGIVTDETSLRYGRMLEVKNIVNREITGLPKMEYWVQMQLQMEVCELNECDFLETRFTEYASKEDYENDTGAEKKGLMMLFMSDKPIYEYAPLSISNNVSISNTVNISDTLIDEWHEAMMEKNSTLTWIKNIYWKLDQLSCVLVLRNKLWFKAIIPQLKDIWATIEKEKQSGYEHRMPKKSTTTKVKKMGINGEDIEMTSQCFIVNNVL
jgi:putative phage-type endonuclease